MAKTMGILSGLLLVFLAAKTAEAETCLYYNSVLDQGTMYCSTGCCGSLYDQYCCFWGTGSIAGTAVGAIVFVAVVVIIVFCCRRRRMAGTVVYTQQINPGISVVSQTTHVQGYAPPPPYPGQPQYPAPAQY